MRYLRIVVRRTLETVHSATRCCVAVLALVSVTGGCEDVSRFSTEPGESFCGQIVPGPFVREGFGPGVRLRLHLDTDHLQDLPGDLSTDDGLFAEASLRPLPPLAHDSLSTFKFGEGRVRNLMYGAHPSDGATAFVVISLLENGDVEVRILRGAPPTAGETEPSGLNESVLFGVFPLVRQRGTCGF